jgi:hypothetical protein
MNLSYEKKDLANSFTQFQVSPELKSFYLTKLKMPHKFTKMMLFATEAKLTNNIIDYWMHIKPARRKNESFIDYKNRQKFQNSLLKYRKYIYNFNKSKNESSKSNASVKRAS